MCRKNALNVAVAGLRCISLSNLFEKNKTAAVNIDKRHSPSFFLHLMLQNACYSHAMITLLNGVNIPLLVGLQTNKKSLKSIKD